MALSACRAVAGWLQRTRSQFCPQSQRTVTPEKGIAWGRQRAADACIGHFFSSSSSPLPLATSYPLQQDVCRG